MDSSEVQEWAQMASAALSRSETERERRGYENRPPWRQRVALLRAERGNKCEKCGKRKSKSNPLEFSHKQPTGLNGQGKIQRERGRGQYQRYRDIKNNPDSYELVCKKTCHDRRKPS